MAIRKRTRNISTLVCTFVLLAWIVSDAGSGHAVAQENSECVGGWMAAFRPSVVEDEGLPWNEGITATYYGISRSSYWGGYGNRIYPATDFFCALPANTDNLDCLGGHLACRMSRCGDAQPTLDQLLASEPLSIEEENEAVPASTEEENENDPASTEEENEDEDDAFQFWPEDDGISTPWIIEGTEGDGLFRVIEIKPAGQDGPVYEAYVGDVGPWGNSDPYWQDYSRPAAEDGIDSRGRRTNRAGIDISYALAQELGCTGVMLIDWRWKTYRSAYVVRRQPTEWRW
jgi:hypothetical protein